MKVSKEALDKRHSQGWVKQKVDNLDDCVNLIREARKNKTSTSIGFLGKLQIVSDRLLSCSISTLK